MVVANEYGLNPFTKEIYAYPDKNKGIVPLVSIDGWIKLCNSHPQFGGFEQEDILDPSDSSKVIAIKTIMWRKDRDKPTTSIEYMEECRPRECKSWEPWARWPRRMLRHKSYIQCARYTFGFSGISDEDEYRRMQESEWAEGAIDVDPRTGQVLDAQQAPDITMTAGDASSHQSHEESADAMAAASKPAAAAKPAKKRSSRKKAAPPPVDAELEKVKDQIEKLLTEYGISVEDQPTIVADALGDGDFNKVGAAMRQPGAVEKLEAFLKSDQQQEVEEEAPQEEEGFGLGGDEPTEEPADPPEPELPSGKKWAHAVLQVFEVSDISKKPDRMGYLKDRIGEHVLKSNGSLNPAEIGFQVYLKLRRTLIADGHLAAEAVVDIGSGDLPV